MQQHHHFSKSPKPSKYSILPPINYEKQEHGISQSRNHALSLFLAHAIVMLYQNASENKQK
jgi:hypothetical protein